MVTNKTRTLHTLRPYQDTIHTSAVQALTTTERTQVIMACASGKTLTGMRITEAMLADEPSSVTVLAFPNLALLCQTVTVWREQSMWRDTFGQVAYADIAVCSQTGVRVDPEEVRKAIAAGRVEPENESETLKHALRGLRVPSTTDADVLTAFLQDHAGRRVVFTTYQSMDVIAQSAANLRSTDPTFQFDFVIADEAHRTTGDETSDTFGTVLYNSRVPARLRLFMTATQRVSERRGRRKKGVRSMDDTTLYGDVSGDYSVKEAIEAGVVSDYRIHVVVVDASDLEAVTGKPYEDLIRGDAGLKAHLLTTAIAVVKMSRRHQLHRILAFHSRVASSQKFVEELEKVAAVMTRDDHKMNRHLTAVHVDGDTPADDRTKVLKHLEALDHRAGEWSVVSNVGVFTEGVDVPALDAVVFADPRNSEVDVAQIIGRALRKSSRKAPVSILVPVLVRDGQDAEHALTESAFNAAAQIMRAMRNVDSRIVERFSVSHMDDITATSSTGTGTDGGEGPGALSDLEVELSAGATWVPDGAGGSLHVIGGDGGVVQVTAGPALVGDVEQPDELVTMPGVMVDIVMPGLRPDELPDFVPDSLDATTAVMVPQRALVDIARLGRAITTRIVNVVLDDFEKNVDTLAVFHTTHGRKPDRVSPDLEEARSGVFLDNARGQARGGRDAHRLTAGRRVYLDRVVPWWSEDLDTDDARERDFRDKADDLAVFHTAHGRKPNRESSDPEEARSGGFLHMVRVQARGGRDAHRLTAGRRVYLDLVAPWWSDDLDVDDARERAFRTDVDALAVLHTTRGRKPNQKSSDPEEKRLGEFLVTIRVQARGVKNAHLLTAGRRAYLDRVAAWWSEDLDADDAHERIFRANADDLAMFHATHGCKPNRKSPDPEERRLGGFLQKVQTQARGGAKAHQLTAVRRAYLDQVTPWWSDGIGVNEVEGPMERQDDAAA